MHLTDYSYAPQGSVQCPRCGVVQPIALSAITRHTLEYAGICTSPSDTGGTCGTTLTLQATAHLFPAQKDPG